MGSTGPGPYIAGMQTQQRLTCHVHTQRPDACSPCLQRHPQLPQRSQACLLLCLRRWRGRGLQRPGWPCTPPRGRGMPPPAWGAGRTHSWAGPAVQPQLLAEWAPPARDRSCSAGGSSAEAAVGCGDHSCMAGGLSAEAAVGCGDHSCMAGESSAEATLGCGDQSYMAGESSAEARLGCVVLRRLPDQGSPLPSGWARGPDQGPSCLTEEFWREAQVTSDGVLSCAACAAAGLGDPRQGPRCLVRTAAAQWQLPLTDSHRQAGLCLCRPQQRSGSQLVPRLQTLKSPKKSPQARSIKAVLPLVPSPEAAARPHSQGLNLQPGPSQQVSCRARAAVPLPCSSCTQQSIWPSYSGLCGCV